MASSQIPGVVVGAVLGFLFAYVPKKIEEHRNHLAFRRILKKEIEQATSLLTSHRNNCVQTWNDISERKLHPQNLMDWLNRKQIYTAEYPTGIFKCNLDKLTPFPEKVVQRLIRFYALIEQCKHGMERLERENPPRDHIPPARIPVGTPNYPDSLKKINILLGAAVQEGEILMKQIDEMIDREWNFKSILNALGKGILGIFGRR
jgi:hypothetical protein